MRATRQWLWLALAICGTLPWAVLRGMTLLNIAHPITVEQAPIVVAALAGLAILAAAFLLSWAAEVAQLDISQGFAVAVLALIAILPEYSVDMYFAWQAGRNPGSDYGHYAIANMTGANRLLIGIAWSAVVFIFWLRTRSTHILIEPSRRLEIFFLLLATAYSFVIPFKRNIGLLDAVVFMGLFVWYIMLTIRQEQTEPDLVGPPVVIAGLAKPVRRGVTLGLFVFSALIILASAEPFSESLTHTGEALGIAPFLMVQWVAPLASEAPEFILASLFALRGHPSLALGTLISSKINQWTLLVGLIPLVYSIAAQHLKALPLDFVQVRELLLTSAQSLFAAALIIDLRLSVREAGALVTIFLAQMVTQVIMPTNEELRLIFAYIYLGLTVLLFLLHKGRRHGLGKLFAPLMGKGERRD